MKLLYLSLALFLLGNLASAHYTAVATKCSGLAACTFSLVNGNVIYTESASAGVGGYVGQSPLNFYGGVVLLRIPGEANSIYISGGYSGNAVLDGYNSIAGTLYKVSGNFLGLDTNTGNIIKGYTIAFVGIKGHSGRGGGNYYTLLNGTMGIYKTNQYVTIANVSCTPSSLMPAQTTKCTATVKNYLPGGIAPPGNVIFSQNGSYGTFSNNGKCTLSNLGTCSVTFKIADEAVGGVSIGLLYKGDKLHYKSSAYTTPYVSSPP